MWDFINPWGALRKARTEILHLTQLATYATDAKIKAEGEANNMSARSLAKTLEIGKLKKLIAKGHFRNPATGRLGKRGETFE